MCKNNEYVFFKKKTKKTTGYKIKKEIKTESWSGRGLTRVLGMMHHRRVSMLGPAPQKGLQLTGPKEKKVVYWPHFWNSHSRLSSGHTDRCFSHREIQWKWKAWLHMPQATLQSLAVAEFWFAWQSIQHSIMWLRQIAQFSTAISIW